MAEIINLRQARKARDRAEKAEVAASNRAKFGRRKADKALDAAKAELADKSLDGHKRET